MKRMYIDIVCASCRTEMRDVFVIDGKYPSCGGCGDQTERLYAAGSSAPVIGDECDVTVRHGICHEDGTPRRYTSKIEMAREATRRGLVNHVEHKSPKGTDKSIHTSRWV